jgi:beta-galactosidase
MSHSSLPRVPHGAVYFRKSNPPREDWERDYRTAAEDAINVFRHWFLWSAIEVAPDVYDWADYDRQLDLAAEHGLKTIIAEMVTVAPEWAYRLYPHARHVDAHGRVRNSQMHGSCVVGGAPGLCLDNEDLREHAGRFLRALVRRYRGHPGLGGYDVWNECFELPDLCYCAGTARRFAVWLRERYGSLERLAEAWHRYSLASWDDVLPPHRGPYPDYHDWVNFRVENAHAHMQWRVDLIRSLDADHPITAHGIAGTLELYPTMAVDDWGAASRVDSYGMTWVASRKGDEPWKQWYAVDLTRAASRGKPFWHAEAQGGPLWLQPQVVGRPREDGRITVPSDIRLWQMVSFAGGATGILYPRWRPLLDGPLFGAFGPYAMDGGRTERSGMSARIARWANAPEQQALWRARPVSGDLGILWLPEAETHCHLLLGSGEAYARAMTGAYRACFDQNVQADWVHPDDIANYRLLYVPCPVMLLPDTARRLVDWVARGGRLVLEGCPGYFGAGGRVDTRQPGQGLAQAFQVDQEDVEFAPDLAGDVAFGVDDLKGIPGGLFWQAYRSCGATIVGRYEDGRVAAVEASYGAGRARILGTFPSYGYAHNPTPQGRELFAHLLTWGGIVPHLLLSDDRLTARLHRDNGCLILWTINPTRETLSATVSLSEACAIRPDVTLYWGDVHPSVSGREIRVTVGERDALVAGFELKN